MVTCAEFWEALSFPFSPEAVSWRVGSTTQDKAKGMALAYVDARDVMERLDSVLGPSKWECRYPHALQKTVCELRCFVPMGDPGDDIKDCTWEWVTKSDGAGDTDFEGVKGALSDAFKRAAVRFGIGRYLYEMATPWMEIRQAGKSFQFTDESLKKLEDYLKKAAFSGQNGTNQERAAMRVLTASLDYISDPERILQFATDKKSIIETLSVGNRDALRSAIRTKIDLAKKAQQEAAA